MSDEQWLREGLADAVPPPPINPDRAGAAERLARRRRRTTTLAVIGSAAAVAAVAVLGTTLASGGDDGPDRQIVAPDPPADVECPFIEVGKGGIAQGVDEPDPNLPDAVPEGATVARLCQGVGTAYDAPADALVTGVDDLVAAINDLDVSGPPEMCTMDLGPGYRIVFGYDDGSTFVVSGQLYGCHTLVVGSGYRADPEAAQAAFLGLLDEQQAAQGEPADDVDAADLSCTDAGGSTRQDLALEAAIVCIVDDSGATVSAAIDDADLDLLTHDMAVNQSAAVLKCALVPPFPTIVAAYDDGSTVTILSECGTSFWRLPNGMAWMPSEDARAILDGLVSSAS
ncbi:hypothetical protein [Nocardioides stalactiti]|uniref:hypothetical protein n=1 Tax=Nocardioides stalactiti TaxID=2755356 RepID=UPI0015FFDE2B|nr:hypothetical protein [Nocardioides stalactiti]